ncbi:hypothetical protein POJ06DRAFT_86121 [Lipomyces tetrasporus]|uniref:Uncharacterized protein n=1 Tax=Lipomyces tetrasporus TaxID=54092 RepID=A0AAD7QU45_9ASCO|nr:uncharacterized protein POJ06DRAFT_86121 [Lipomyces tetrasporus]KAJ8101001.1 hypothetical protein POJ06DRAFT_86121 [Lipomyces tetrasporus]
MPKRVTCYLLLEFVMLWMVGVGVLRDRTKMFVMYVNTTRCIIRYGRGTSVFIARLIGLGSWCYRGFFLSYFKIAYLRVCRPLVIIRFRYDIMVDGAQVMAYLRRGFTYKDLQCLEFYAIMAVSRIYTSIKLKLMGKLSLFNSLSSVSSS